MLKLMGIKHYFYLSYAFLAFSFCLISFTATARANTPELNSLKRINQQLVEKWGIEIVSLRMTAVNYMVDFRYRVLDAEKASPLFKRQAKPYLLDQASQKVLAVPNMGKVGPLRTSNPPKEGRIYWMFFGNGNGLVHSGSKVTIIIEDFRVENLIVQ